METAGRRWTTSRHLLLIAASCVVMLLGIPAGADAADQVRWDRRQLTITMGNGLQATEAIELDVRVRADLRRADYEFRVLASEALELGDR